MGDFPFSTGQASVAWMQSAAGHSQKLQGWYAAAAGWQTARANVCIIGNSITAGQGASSFANCYQQLLAPLLRNRLIGPTATGGRGFLPPIIPPSNPTSFTPSYVTVASSANLIAGSLYGFGPNLETWDITHTANNTLTYSLVGDSADILWAGSNGNGTIGWAVTGGGSGTISTNTAFNPAGSTNVSLGAAGAHTLTLTNSAGSPTFVTGVIEYNGDRSAGIQVHNLGFSGSTSGFWTVAGGNVSGGAALAALAPSLIIIELGVNDNGSGIAPAVTASNVAAVIAQTRSALTTAAVTVPPFLLLADYNAASDGPTSAALWANYVNALYGVAAADPLVDILDLSLYRMPSTAAAQTWGLYNVDGIHPTNAGHAAMANFLASYLCPA